MATTTPNYGWSVPTSTDLVKDGATAIETLGDSADATVKALNPETTLGDISYRSSTSNTKTRLGIGSTGQVLTVASGVPSWATPAGGGGKVLQVVQGTSSTTVTVASTTFTDIGPEFSITPTLNTSKILVMVNQQIEVSRLSNEIGCGIRLLRNGTAVFTQAASFASLALQVSSSTESGLNSIVSFNYLDSPATTSAVLYKMQGRASTTANSGLVRGQGSSSTTVVTLIEIGA